MAETTTPIKAHMIAPCENCPYRRDAPIKHWDQREYLSVLKGEYSDLGTTFACHKQRDLPPNQRGLCAGFLLDQKERDVPSIMLRLLLSTDQSARDAYERVHSDVPMYVDAIEMCRANGLRIPPRRTDG